MLQRGPKCRLQSQVSTFQGLDLLCEIASPPFMHIVIMASKEFLSKQTKLAPQTEEWSLLEYNLQLAIGSTAPILKQVWSVANAHMSSLFDRRAKSSIVLDSWLSSSSFEESNRLEDVCTQGFKMPRNGLVFTSGTIKMPSESSFSYGRTYEFMFVKLAVGRPFFTTVDQLGFGRPPNYDSLYLFKPEDEGATYQHDYLLFDTNQALPCFIVHFELDPSREEALAVKMCDVCGESPSAIYCKADDAVLCYDCDDEIHSRGNKLSQRHQRVPVHERPKSFGFCREHSDMVLEYFCNTCKVPICIHCKMAGSHSLPSTADHVLLPIQDAYRRAVTESRELDPILEQKRNTLSLLLQSVDDRVNEVKRNAEDVEAKVYQLLQDMLLRLHEETQEKVAALLCAQLEMKRQIDYINWVECFLKYQQEVLSPSIFMTSWGRHLSLRQGLHTSEDLAELHAIQPDIKLEGKMQIVVESKVREAIQPSEPASAAPVAEPSLITSKFRNQLFSKFSSTAETPTKQIPRKPTDFLQFKIAQMLKLDSQRSKESASEYFDEDDQ